MPRISSRSSIRCIVNIRPSVRDTRRLAGVFFSLLILHGCASAPQTRALLDRPPDDIPRQVELTTTPFFPQQRYQCGPAALATVLTDIGIAVTPEQLVDEVYVPALQGSLPEEIAAAARQRGVLVYPLTAHLGDLLQEVAAGHPVLVFQNLGLDWLPRRHFAVLVGYDLDHAEVVLRSGTTARHITTLSTFERTWLRAGGKSLIVIRPGALPASAEPVRYLQSVNDLESTLDNSAVTQAAWLAATTRWPEQPLVWLALGNHAYTGQDWSQARAAFLQVTQLAPRDPRGWNNLAYTLLQQGCPQQALQSAQCAARLAPADANVRDTLREIRTDAAHPGVAQCPPVHCPSF